MHTSTEYAGSAMGSYRNARAYNSGVYEVYGYLGFMRIFGSFTKNKANPIFNQQYDNPFYGDPKMVPLILGNPLSGERSLFNSSPQAVPGHLYPAVL